MGEAKRKRAQQEIDRAQEALVDHAATRVGVVLQKLASAASSNYGADCYLHAEMGRVLLQDLGVQSRCVVGYAAWRVGAGDGDVIAHTNKVVGHLPEGSEGLAYHAWLESGDRVIDFTTYQLRDKARGLDAMDGGSTQVEWCPDLLILKKKQLHNYIDVAQRGPGLAYYEEVLDLFQKLEGRFNLDPDDVETARLILRSPGIQVFGPENLRPESMRG